MIDYFITNKMTDINNLLESIFKNKKGCRNYQKNDIASMVVSLIKFCPSLTQKEASYYLLGYMLTNNMISPNFENKARIIYDELHEDLKQKK